MMESKPLSNVMRHFSPLKMSKFRKIRLTKQTKNFAMTIIRRNKINAVGVGTGKAKDVAPDMVAIIVEGVTFNKIRCIQ